MTERERVRRAEEAQRLKEDPFFVSVLEEIETDAIQAWKTAATLEHREARHAEVTAVRLVRDRLELIVQQGEHSRTLLEIEENE